MSRKSDTPDARPPSRHRPAPPAVRLREFSQSLPMALMRARESVMAHFRASLRRHDVTEQQWRVLRALNSHGALEVSALARASYLLGPSLTRILKDLEQRGLLTRQAVARDLRRSVVSITPAGTALIAVVAPESEAIYAEIARRYGPERLAALIEMLHELEDAMQVEDLAAPGDGRADTAERSSAD